LAAGIASYCNNTPADGHIMLPSPDESLSDLREPP
jgi:hypothetical protein